MSITNHSDPARGDSFTPFHRTPALAFESAIRAGGLTECKTAYHFAGNFMYMHTELIPNGGAVDSFKHIDTRRYVRVPVTSI